MSLGLSELRYHLARREFDIDTTAVVHGNVAEIGIALGAKRMPGARRNDDHVTGFRNDLYVINGVSASALNHDEHLAAGVPMREARCASGVVAHTDREITEAEIIALHKTERPAVGSTQILGTRGTYYECLVVGHG